ncbi:hypothetical protein BUH_3734 [Burkholderia pseudomallei Pakistan 9]|nr:hypothetical protein BUH_3734 [Burkholderia pseudomallei Pakistan 9]
MAMWECPTSPAMDGPVGYAAASSSRVASSSCSVYFMGARYFLTKNLIKFRIKVD